MGDWFQTIVDIDASLEETGPLSAAILNWLVEEGIVEKTLTDCVLGHGGQGHGPGQNYEQVVKRDGFPIRELMTNGLDIVVGRTVFHPGQGTSNKVCPACGATTECDDEWLRAVGQWYKGEPDDFVRCANCGYANSIAEWSADLSWGFGNLGFKFWNWSRLNQSFIDEFGRRLGHRIVFVAGKL